VGPYRRMDGAQPGTAPFLASAGLPTALVAWLANRPPDQLALMADRSFERTTHFKWFFGADQDNYIVWLHEYKAPTVFARAVDFAASVHNHRYGFCSRVLSGALHVSDFDLIAEREDRVRLAGTRTIRVGETMTLSHEDVHRVDRVEPRTHTLLVQGPAARSFSTCYDLATGHGQRMYDLKGRLPHTIARLKDECMTSTAMR
jgi:hypothetical protein